MNTCSYYISGESILPKPWKTYFYPGCEEWNDLDEEEKFMDLTYTLNNGLDMLDCIEEYMREHDYVEERDGQGSFVPTYLHLTLQTEKSGGKTTHNRNFEGQSKFG